MATLQDIVNVSISLNTTGVERADFKGAVVQIEFVGPAEIIHLVQTVAIQVVPFAPF